MDAATGSPSLMLILRWVVSTPLLAFALLGMLGNWASLIHNLLAGSRGWRQTSSIWFMPGVAGLLGMFACPIGVVHHYAWLALLLDPTLAMAALVPVVEGLRRMRLK